MSEDTTAITGDKSVMTVKEAAFYLQVSERSIYNMAASHEIPAAKVAGQWRFYKPEIDRWLTRLSRENVYESTPFDLIPAKVSVNGKV